MSKARRIVDRFMVFASLAGAATAVSGCSIVLDPSPLLGGRDGGAEVDAGSDVDGGELPKVDAGAEVDAGVDVDAGVTCSPECGPSDRCVSGMCLPIGEVYALAGPVGDPSTEITATLRSGDGRGECVAGLYKREASFTVPAGASVGTPALATAGPLASGTALGSDDGRDGFISCRGQVRPVVLTPAMSAAWVGGVMRAPTRVRALAAVAGDASDPGGFLFALVETPPFSRGSYEALLLRFERTVDGAIDLDARPSILRLEGAAELAGLAVLENATASPQVCVAGGLGVSGSVGFDSARFELSRAQSGTAPEPFVFCVTASTIEAGPADLYSIYVEPVSGDPTRPLRLTAIASSGGRLVVAGTAGGTFSVGAKRRSYEMAIDGVRGFRSSANVRSWMVNDSTMSFEGAWLFGFEPGGTSWVIPDQMPGARIEALAPAASGESVFAAGSCDREWLAPTAPAGSIRICPDRRPSSPRSGFALSFDRSTGAATWGTSIVEAPAASIAVNGSAVLVAGQSIEGGVRVISATSSATADPVEVFAAPPVTSAEGYALELGFGDGVPGRSDTGTFRAIVIGTDGDSGIDRVTCVAAGATDHAWQIGAVVGGPAARLGPFRTPLGPSSGPWGAYLSLAPSGL